jgi:hypothetical protein
MEFYTIENLKKDAAQNNLFNFFDASFKYLTNVILYTFLVKEGNEMRIDTISHEMYGDVKYCDFILNLNNIDNPLNIMVGDILYYVSQDQISYFNIDESTAKSLRNTYLNINKVSKQDPNRSSYIDNNYQLPPTFLDIPTSSVSIVDGKIVLGGN